MADGAPLIWDLLDYIQQMEKMNAKPAFSVPTDYFIAHEYELRGLPEVRFNQQVEGDDVWLRVPRLQEISAPDLDEILKPWVTLTKSPSKPPELKQEALSVDGKRLLEPIQLNDHPEVQALFDWYLEFLWRPWAVVESLRRRTMAKYNKLFSLQQAIALEGAETPLELVWGIGWSSWKKEGIAVAVEHPLLVQACEVSLNETTLDLEVRPRDLEPRLETDCYAAMELAGVGQLETFWRSALASGADRINPFEPATYEGTLKSAVGHLDPTGAYESCPADPKPPTATGHLKISNTWVLFARKRSGDIFLEDIRRLKQSVEAAREIPSVLRSLVERGDATVRVRPEVPFRGLASSESPAGASELYFPMPYNDEQVSIIQKLANNDGVVVQGPPGTGKTHTIANVICHYLALGKRVLVTAKGESALAVLQEKLPERVRPLSVALLSDERDGMKQFEHAIQVIAANVAGLNPTRSAASIAAAEGQLNQVHARIANLDRTIAEFAARHMRTYSFQGQAITPEEMAKLVLSQAEESQWFDDEPRPGEKEVLPVEESAIQALRQARITVGRDLDYLGCSLPDRAELPLWVDLVVLHRDLIKEKAIDLSVAGGFTLALADSRMETLAKAQALVPFLEARLALHASLASSCLAWLEPLARRLQAMPANGAALQTLIKVCRDIRDLENQRQKLLAQAVELPAEAEVHPEFMAAIARLQSGRSGFALPFGQRAGRQIVAAVTVSGLAPGSQADWAMVQQTLEWRTGARKVLARWAALSTEFGFPTPGSGLEAGFKDVCHWQTMVENLRRLVFEFDAGLDFRVKEVFGSQTADRMGDATEPWLATVLASLQAHLDKIRLAEGKQRVEEWLRGLEPRSGRIVEEVRTFLRASVGVVGSDEARLERTWLALEVELARVTALQPALETIAQVTELIEVAGAERWARRLRTVVASSDQDPVAPSGWLAAWNWRLAVMFLDRIDGHHVLRDLFADRRTQALTLTRTYQELVAEKTWLGVFHNSPDRVRQALQAYLNAVQAMGSGKGIRAIRYRKDARHAMQQAYQAVPCWVLPQWRVSETLPAELGLFDLVIVDEASQSDIWALPALLRGKKLLVVGDHKQVSPSAVGVADRKIQELINRFLNNQPFGSEMTPEKSIYDLARVVFAGNSVMLKEHFRCVPAIIEFSNREFYENDIRALRVPKANERLDPPLIDIFVKGGFRQGDLNRPEAKAVVDELEAILLNPDCAGRSIGVVTLLGTQQAAHIHELVSARISPVDVVARRIAIGPPPVFQGRERDIMLVSMVLAPGDRAAANRADLHQRFNVALSRARDRMILFRSVGDAEFKEDTLNGRVLQHFKQPFRRDVHRVQALRERCESGFERDMFDELVRRGFRVEPQVPCGGYRIDFVIEGAEGRRLAVECDGDRFHGPGQWQDDMTRQRILERAGWTFWRCFASSFVRRRAAVIADLLQTLERLGIEPLGADSVDSTPWVQYREVDPFGVEAEQEAVPT